MLSPGRGPGALAAALDRGPGRRGVPAEGRADQSGRHHPGTRPRRAPRRRAHRRGPQGDRVSAARRGRVTGVATEAGEVRADVVVNCAGMWAREVGGWANVERAAARGRALLHRHAADSRADVGLPDPARCRRLLVLQGGHRQAPGGLVRAAGEALGRGRNPGELRLRPAAGGSWPHRAAVRRGHAPRAGARERRRAGVLQRAGELHARRPLPARRGARGCAACTSRPASTRSASSRPAGAGKVLADWIVDGHPPFDLWDVDIRRCAPFQRNRRYLRDRTVETLGLLYAMHWPFRQAETARGVRRSALHDRLAAAGACFGEVAGFERANWFAAAGQRAALRVQLRPPELVRALRRRAPRGARAGRPVRPVLLRQVRAEGTRCRARCCHGSVPTTSTCRSGRVVYTQWLNERGGIEADVTVTREAEDAYLIVSSCATQTRDFNWLRRSIPSAARALAFDISSAYAVLGLMGPRSRELLAHAHAMRTCRPPPSPSALRSRLTLATRGCVPAASLMSASSATSCTFPPSSRNTCTTRSSPPARPSDCSSRAITP